MKNSAPHIIYDTDFLNHERVCKQTYLSKTQTVTPTL